MAPRPGFPQKKKTKKLEDKGPLRSRCRITPSTKFRPYLEPEFISFFLKLQHLDLTAPPPPPPETASIAVHQKLGVSCYHPTAMKWEAAAPGGTYCITEHVALFSSVEGKEKKKKTQPPLSLFVPKAHLFLRNVVGEVVTFAAALYATLVAGASARAVPAAAVLEQTRVPFQAQAVRAQARLPHVLGGVTSLEAGSLRG